MERDLVTASQPVEPIQAGDLVRCWPGARPEGRTYIATALTGVVQFAGLDCVRVQRQEDGGTDYITLEHVELANLPASMLEPVEFDDEPEMADATQTAARDPEWPRQGHDCPLAGALKPNVDDLCDLPEPWRRLAYAINIDSQHFCGQGAGHDGYFCKHAVWREVVDLYRDVVTASRTDRQPRDSVAGANSGQGPGDLDA